jgi:DNA-directed RNA polymerase subunit RPC12/RpoP
MNGQEENESIMSKNKCPGCGWNLGKFTRKETNAEFKSCSNCGRKWEIIGGYPNGYPCEDFDKEKPKPKRSAIHNRDISIREFTIQEIVKIFDIPEHLLKCED